MPWKGRRSRCDHVRYHGVYASLDPLLRLVEAHVMTAERLHADDRRCRCWPRARPTWDGAGSTSGTAGCLGARADEQRCFSTDATAWASFPKGIWPDVPASCRPTPMTDTASSIWPGRTRGLIWEPACWSHARCAVTSDLSVWSSIDTSRSLPKRSRTSSFTSAKRRWERNDAYLEPRMAVRSRRAAA